MSSLHTSLPTFYQPSRNDVLRQNTILSAYADDEDDDDDRDHDDDDTPADLSALTNEELVALFQDTVRSLERLGNVLDEAAIVDVAKQKITDLKNKVKQLVVDKDLKKDLLKILSKDLKKLNKIDKPILSGKETKANKKIKDVQEILSDFVSELQDERGEEISNALADELISDATIISSDLGKRDRDIIPVIQSYSLPLTKPLIDKSKMELQILKDIVAELQSRGVEIQFDTQTNSPIIPVVVILGVRIGLSSWHAYEVTNQVNDALIAVGEPPLNDYEYVGLFLINAAGFFALDKFVSEPIAKSITKDLGRLIVGLKLPSEFLELLIDQVYPLILTHDTGLSLLERNLIITLRSNLQQTATIRGLKFNDRNNNRRQDSGEEGREGWEFVIVAIFGSGRAAQELGRTVSGSNGEFSTTVEVPSGVTHLQAIETLQAGWESTTGESQTIPFTPDPDTRHFDSDILEFGNRQEIAPPPPPGGGTGIDIVTSFANRGLVVFLADGAGGFGQPTIFDAGLPPLLGTLDAASGDFNNDRNEDVVQAFFPGSVGVFIGDGAGGFVQPIIFNAGTDGLVSIAVSDFNSDGKDDVVTASFSSNSLSVLLGDGTGEFGPPNVIGTGGVNVQEVAVGDFNGDGKDDVVTANFNSLNLSVLLGDGTGEFGPPNLINIGRSSQFVTVDDFNDDGKDDVLATAFNAKIIVLLGDGTGGFSQQIQSDVPGFLQAGEVAVIDFNGDGKKDIVSTDQSLKISTLLGNGAGGFSQHSLINTGVSPNSIALADFNGDGKKDVALVTNEGKIVILLADGAGGFGPPNVIDTPFGTMRSIIAADFNPPASPPPTPNVFLDNSFDTSLDGWTYFGHSGYSLTLDTTNGQPAPAAHISGDTYQGICSIHGMEKVVDISSRSAAPLMLEFDYKATSSSTLSQTTLLDYGIINADNGASLFTERLVGGGITDSGWRSHSKDITSIVSGVNRINLQLNLYDCWIIDYSENNWYDNIMLFQ